MVDLGLLGGIPTFPTASGKHAQANAINDLGQIVGSSSYDNAAFYYATHAFLTTTAGGAMTDLGTLGGSFSAANAINMAGQIVGNSSLAGDTSGHATPSSCTPLASMASRPSGSCLPPYWPYPQHHPDRGAGSRSLQQWPSALAHMPLPRFEHCTSTM